jgi:hypothetical protein
MPPPPLPVLGVDIGGVLIDRVAEDSDTSFFGDRPMETPAVADAVETLARLNDGLFAGRVHLISKAGPKISERTKAWLAHTGFADATGIGDDHVHFVRNREDKAPDCRRLGVTHFVDDRLSVLTHLASVQHRYLFTGGLGAHPAPSPADVPDWAELVEDWPELERRLHRSVSGTAPEHEPHRRGAAEKGAR